MKPISRWPASALALLLLAASPAGARTWTSSDGKTLEAEIARSDTGHALL